MQFFPFHYFYGLCGFSQRITCSNINNQLQNLISDWWYVNAALQIKWSCISELHFTGIVLLIAIDERNWKIKR